MGKPTRDRYKRPGGEDRAWLSTGRDGRSRSSTMMSMNPILPNEKLSADRVRGG